MTGDFCGHPQTGTVPGLTTVQCKPKPRLTECLETAPNSCPRLTVPGGLLPPNADIALGYLGLVYRPVPIIQDGNGSWIPSIRWAPFDSGHKECHEKRW